MPRAIERAAGGLVFRKGKNGLEVLMIQDAYGKLTFPKGHLEAFESFEDAAIREIEEETGIKSRLIETLGRVEYPVMRDGQSIRKQVRLYLLEAIDEQDEPCYQQEEIKAAFYLSLDEAKRKHETSGYANWIWVFDKAKALWDWHEGRWENEWRLLDTRIGSEAVIGKWKQVENLVKQIIRTTHAELQVTAKNTVENYVDELENMNLPLPGPFEKGDILRAIEQTRLNPEASVVDIENLCLQAKEHGFGLVCIPPRHVALAKDILQGSDTRVCTVLGFPHGAQSAGVLEAEMEDAVRKGALEVDMVIPVGAMAEDDVWSVHEMIRSAIIKAETLTPRPCVKVILETSALSFSQVIKAGIIACSAGADFIKTSTGFHKRGANIADVSAMRLVMGAMGRVKASGGVRTKEDALMFLAFGASRIGTSSGMNLVR
jgi:deoxyribose-phosphate aldolase